MPYVGVRTVLSAAGLLKHQELISSSLGVVGLGPRSCAASPAANHLADRSPATIHYASDTDDSDVEPLSPNA